jgi:hypothetical protein
MSSLEFGLRCIGLLALIFAACVAVSIVLGWLSDQLTGKDLDE